MIKELLKYLFGFVVADGGGSSVKIGTATIAGMVDGLPNAPLVPADVVITLSGNTFEEIGAGTNVVGWFSNLPGGLIAKIKNDVEGGTTATITLSGTPTAESEDDIEITIPKGVLSNKNDDIEITPTPNAAYRIDYTIRSIADFEAFARAVNGDGYTDAVTLDANLTVPSGASYIPIARPVVGTGGTLVFNPYTGTFDGNGHTITIALTGTASYLALFAHNNKLIKNLTVAGTVLATINKTTPKDIDYVAGVVAYNDIGGTIERVISQVAITADESVVTSDHEDIAIHSIGGIAGFNGWDQYSIDSPHYSPADEDTYQQGGTIHQCRNEGAIIGGQNKIGGIAGENAWKITECANTGAIKCVKSGELHPRWPGMGGIAGRNGNNNNPTEYGDIENCYNWGNIYDDTDKNIDHDNYGGITGWCDAHANIKNCYTTGMFYQPDTDLENHPITGTKNPIIGSIDEDVTNMSTNNYALITIFTSSEDPALIGEPRDANAMTLQPFVNELNGSSSGGPFILNPGPNGGYPILGWEDE
jgi:hypothetical protein